LPKEQLLLIYKESSGPQSCGPRIDSGLSLHQLNQVDKALGAYLVPFLDWGTARLNLDRIYENISSPGEAGSTDSGALTAR
jgi:hypothetical protein